MHRVDDPSAGPAVPTPGPQGTPGYFQGAQPTTGQQATIVTVDWANAVQEEIAHVVESAGLTLSKTDRTQLLQAIAKLTRTRLTANQTFYVSPTGNNSNNGLTPATAWADPSYAYRTIIEYYDLAGYSATVQLANGTYTNLYVTGSVQNGTISFLGNTSDPSQVVINGSNSPAIAANLGAFLYLDSITVTATGSSGLYTPGGAGLLVWNGAIFFKNIHFGACQQAHIYAEWAGMISLWGGIGTAYTINGGAPWHVLSSDNSVIDVAGANVTLVGTPNFSSAFAAVAQNAVLGAPSMTFTGGATGQRYAASTNGVIQTGGNGPNYFPGNTAGNTSSGGQYV
jgi:hypothetical protein